MAVYHGAWDLNALGFAKLALYDDPFWLAFRAVILGSFLLLVGVSLVLASRHGFNRRAFFRRLGAVAGCAVLISLYSQIMFPQAAIFFGVLHFITVASILGLLFLSWPRRMLLLLALVVFVFGLLSHPVFDSFWLRWIGFLPDTPQSRDYVPMIPWFGFVLVGIALGQWLATAPRRVGAWAPRMAPTRCLAFAGRHALAIYMLHQPILFAVLFAAASALAPDRVSLDSLGTWFGKRTSDRADFAESFLDSCHRKCESDGANPAACTRLCACMLAGVQQSVAPETLAAGRLPPETQAIVERLAKQCAESKSSD